MSLVNQYCLTRPCACQGHIDFFNVILLQLISLADPSTFQWLQVQTHLVACQSARCLVAFSSQVSTLYLKHHCPPCVVPNSSKPHCCSVSCFFWLDRLSCWDTPLNPLSWKQQRLHVLSTLKPHHSLWETENYQISRVWSWKFHLWPSSSGPYSPLGTQQEM